MSESAPKNEQFTTGQIPEIVSPIPQISEDVNDTPEARFSSWLKSAGFAAALSLVSPAEASPTKQEKNEPLLENERVVAEVLGTQLAEKYRANGFEITVPLEADEHGHYIVHIGQTHESPIGGLHGLRTVDVVKEFQDTLSETLSNTAKSAGGVVFSEGISSTAEELAKVRDSVLALKDGLEKFADHEVLSLSSAIKCMQQIQAYQRYRNNSLVRNSISKAAVENASKNLEGFIERYQPRTADEKNELETIKVVLEIGNYGEISDGLEGREDFMSATLTLYMNGEIKIAATEDPDLNEQVVATAREMVAEKSLVTEETRKALDSDTKLRTLQAELDLLFEKFKQGTHTPEEEVRLRTVYDLITERKKQIEAGFGDELRALKDRFALQQKKRNQEVLEKIEEYEKAHGKLTHAVVVYGAAHNFENALQEYNSNNKPDAVDRGLIKIEKRKD